MKPSYANDENLLADEVVEVASINFSLMAMRQSYKWLSYSNRN